MKADDFCAIYGPGWTASWEALVQREPESGLLLQLTQRYCEAHRHYHTLEHLGACLTHFQALRAQAEHPDEVALALWFHDAVYDIGAKDNERRSADWARASLSAAGADAAVAQRVHDLIMATCHDRSPSTRDAQILLDVDLAILGARVAVFDAYEQQIRSEYRSVPEPQMRANRRRILQGFLARPQIYHTPLFSERFEAPARANLARSIAALAD